MSPAFSTLFPKLHKLCKLCRIVAPRQRIFHQSDLAQRRKSAHGGIKVQIGRTGIALCTGCNHRVRFDRRQPTRAEEGPQGLEEGARHGGRMTVSIGGPKAGDTCNRLAIRYTSEVSYARPMHQCRVEKCLIAFSRAIIALNMAVARSITPRSAKARFMTTIPGPL